MAGAAVDGVGGGALAAAHGYVRRNQVAGPGAAGSLLRGEARAEGEGRGAGPRRVVQDVACGSDPASLWGPRRWPALGTARRPPRTPPAPAALQPRHGARLPAQTSLAPSVYTRPTPYRCSVAACIWAPGLCRALRWGRGAGGAAKGRPRLPSP